MENKEKTTEQAEQEEIVETVEAVSSALRGPKYGIFEQLICQRLIMSTVTTDPLRKVELVTEAAMMLDKDKLKASTIDSEKVEIINSVCVAFQHCVETKLKNHSQPMKSVKFGFPETEESLSKYIKPWLQEESLRCFVEFLPDRFGEKYVIGLCSCCGNEVVDKFRGKFGIAEKKKNSYDSHTYDTCQFCGADLDDYNRITYRYLHSFKWKKDIPAADFTFTSFSVLHESGYVAAKNNFLLWCLPFVLELTRKLTETVRPEIYNEIAKMFGDTRGKEKNCL